MRKKLRRFVAGLLCGIIILTNAGLEETVCAASMESFAMENGVAEAGTATGESQETAEDPVAEGTEGQEKSEESQEAEQDPAADDTQGQEEPEKETVADQPVTENPETGENGGENATYTLKYSVNEDGTATITGYEGTASGDLVLSLIHI